MAGATGGEVSVRCKGRENFMLPVGNLWEDVGKVVAWWVMLYHHWHWVFDRGHLQPLALLKAE